MLKSQQVKKPVAVKRTTPLNKPSRHITTKRPVASRSSPTLKSLPASQHANLASFSLGSGTANGNNVNVIQQQSSPITTSTTSNSPTRRPTTSRHSLVQHNTRESVFGKKQIQFAQFTTQNAPKSAAISLDGDEAVIDPVPSTPGLINPADLTPEQLLVMKNTNLGGTQGDNAHETGGKLIGDDGLPIRRISSKGTYIQDHSLLRHNQQSQPRAKEPSGITDWPAYKELSTLVTSGGRSNVYHWLSDRDNRLKVNLNVRDPYGSTLLAQAARRHYYAVALTLLPFCDTNYETLQGPPIFHSLSLADLLVTRALLDFGADPNSRNPQGQTPLMMAACVDNVSFVQYLIFKGANLDDQDSKGRTPLMYAAKKCSPQIARYLHMCGANVDLRDNNGQSAIDYAKQRGDRDGDYLASVLARLPPTTRILPKKGPIQKDLEKYVETKLYPRPINFSKLKVSYDALVAEHGYNNLVVDPNGAVYLRSADEKKENSDKNGQNGQNGAGENNFIEDGDELPMVQSTNSFTRRSPRREEETQRGKRYPPNNKQRRTVLEDLLERSDFASRPIEHVDERYLDWYDRCRAIHLEDEGFRSQLGVQGEEGKVTEENTQKQ